MTLKEKLLKVMSAVAVLGKDSRNAEIGYDYVSAAKFKRGSKQGTSRKPYHLHTEYSRT